MEALTAVGIGIVWVIMIGLVVASIAGLGWVAGRAAQIRLDQPRARRATWREN